MLTFSPYIGKKVLPHDIMGVWSCPGKLAHVKSQYFQKKAPKHNFLHYSCLIVAPVATLVAALPTGTR